MSACSPATRRGAALMVFLDTNPVIYFVEQPPIWGLKAKTRITTLLAAGEQLAVTDLVRMECLVGPLKKGDAKVESDFRNFFTSPDLRVLPITAAVCERAARIQTPGFVTPGCRGRTRLHAVSYQRRPVEFLPGHSSRSAVLRNSSTYAR